MDKTKKLAEMCMAVDKMIWENRGIVCDVSTDPSIKTIVTEWDRYKPAVERWLYVNKFREMAATEIDSIVDILEGNNFYSFSVVLKEYTKEIK